jgi:hypothetical protein
MMVKGSVSERPMTSVLRYCNLRFSVKLCCINASKKTVSVCNCKEPIAPPPLPEQALVTLVTTEPFACFTGSGNGCKHE